MKTFILVLIVITIAMTIADFILVFKHCNAGFLGYEEEWLSEKAERAHCVLSPIILALCLMLAIIGVILELKF